MYSGAPCAISRRSTANMSNNLPALASVLPRAHGVRVYRSGLAFDVPLAYRDLEQLCYVLSEIDDVTTDSLPLWEADALAHGEFVHGETYAQLLALWPERALGTLRNRMWVGKRVPLAMRLEASPRGDVPYTLCRIVAPLPTPEMRLAVLKLAMQEEWTTREAEEYVRLCQEETEVVRLDTPPIETDRDTGEPPTRMAYPSDLEDVLVRAFDALAARDWETVGQLLDKAVIIVRRGR